MYVAGADCQRGAYFDTGGQPGNLLAWQDATVNKACDNFFLATLDTLQNAYLRPRYSGYISFQTQAGSIIHEFLKNGGNPAEVLDQLDGLYVATGNSSPLVEWRSL